MGSDAVINGTKKSVITKRLQEKRVGNFDKSLRPVFPKNIMVELAFVCNHSCAFCAYSKSTRKRRVAEPSLMERIIKDAYDLGTREIGLHAGTEPYASKHLEYFIGYAKELGYTYVYLTTNGSLCDPERLKASVDNGLDSIKFSVNAGDRETYKRVHGRDDFDKVIEHIKFLDRYRKEKDSGIYVSVSFVEYSENAGQFEQVRMVLDPYTDEIIKSIAHNQLGQMPGQTVRKKIIENAMEPTNAPLEKIVCSLPFNRIHISSEGYLRACCSDYQNYLAIADLNTVSLKDAFYSQRAIEHRRRMLSGETEGLICHSCLYGNCRNKVKPLDEKLATEVNQEFFGGDND